MKAYSITDKDCTYTAVIFAETRGKAVSYALCIEPFEYCRFTELYATRRPELDSSYRGHTEMDWDDDEDRADMVRHAGFQCDEEYFDFKDCVVCTGKPWCSLYEERAADGIGQAFDPD